MEIRGGKSQRGEEPKREDQRIERVRRKKEQWFVAPEGRKVGSLKRRVRSHVVRLRDEKLRAVVARSTFPSQNVQSTLFSEHFWKLRCRKGARRCGAKHMSKSKSAKKWRVRYGPLFDVQMPFCVAGCAPCQKWENREGFVAFSKTMAGVGHLKRICKDAFRVAGAIQKTHELDVLGDQCGDFLRGVAFWNMRSWILRGRCSTSCDLASLMPAWQAQYFRQMQWKNRKTQWYEDVSSAPNVMLTSIASSNDF